MKYLPEIHLACSDDPLRPALNVVEIKNGVATATNGNFIVRIGLAKNSMLAEETIDQLNGKFIHRDVWKFLVKATEILIGDDKIRAFFGSFQADFYFSEVPDFPNYHTIINDTLARERKIVETIGFKGKFLNIICKIFSEDKLRFEIFDSSRSALIFPMSSDEEDKFALIMPIVYQDLPLFNQAILHA